MTNSKVSQTQGLLVHFQ